MNSEQGVPWGTRKFSRCWRVWLVLLGVGVLGLIWAFLIWLRLLMPIDQAGKKAITVHSEGFSTLEEDMDPSLGLDPGKLTQQLFERLISEWGRMSRAASSGEAAPSECEVADLFDQIFLKHLDLECVLRETLRARLSEVTSVKKEKLMCLMRQYLAFGCAGYFSAQSLEEMKPTFETSPPDADVYHQSVKVYICSPAMSHRPFMLEFLWQKTATQGWKFFDFQIGPSGIIRGCITQWSQIIEEEGVESLIRFFEHHLTVFEKKA